MFHAFQRPSYMSVLEPFQVMAEAPQISRTTCDTCRQRPLPSRIAPTTFGSVLKVGKVMCTRRASISRINCTFQQLSPIQIYILNIRTALIPIAAHLAC